METDYSCELVLCVTSCKENSCELLSHSSIGCENQFIITQRIAFQRLI